MRFFYESGFQHIDFDAVRPGESFMPSLSCNFARRRKGRFCFAARMLRGKICLMNVNCIVTVINFIHHPSPKFTEAVKLLFEISK